MNVNKLKALLRWQQRSAREKGLVILAIGIALAALWLSGQQARQQAAQRLQVAEVRWQHKLRALPVAKPRGQLKNEREWRTAIERVAVQVQLPLTLASLSAQGKATLAPLRLSREQLGPLFHQLETHWRIHAIHLVRHEQHIEIQHLVLKDE